VMVQATNKAIAMSRSSNVRTRTAAVYRAAVTHPEGHFRPSTHREPSRRKYRVGAYLRVIVRIHAQADDPHVTAPGISAKGTQDSKA
jgi:hypothetical protein